MRRFNDLANGHGRVARVRAVSIGVLAIAAFAVGNAVAALAGSPATKLCIPKAAGKPVTTPDRKNRCARKYKLTALAREGRPGPQGKEGPRGERGERGEKGEAAEALQFSVNAEGAFTAGQVVSVPPGSYGQEKASPENTISYGPINFSAHGLVAEILVVGRESLGEVAADLHATNLEGNQTVGGVTGRVVPRGKTALLELTHIGFQAGTDLYLKEGRLYSEKGGTYWVKVGISLPPR